MTEARAFFVFFYGIQHKRGMGVSDSLYYLLQKVSISFSRHRGLRILSELIRKRFVGAGGSLVTSRFDRDLKFRCELDEHIGSYIFWRGAYSRDILKVLEPILSEEMTFVDVGANQGEFTLFAAKRLRKGRVIAFEPTSYMYEKLVNNIALNGFKNIELVNQALSDKPGQLPIYMPKGKFSDGTSHFGLSSLYKSPAGSDCMEIINVTTLDEYVKRTQLSHIDVMKIDIEGSELFMLRGAARTLKAFKPVLIVEIGRGPCLAAGYDCREILEYIASYGYRIEFIMPGGKTRPLESRALAENQNMICYPV